MAKSSLPHGAGFVPEDRQHDALVLEFTLAENVALRGAGARGGRMRWNEVKRLTRALSMVSTFVVEMRIGPLRTLSGGNQQKLILARESNGSPRLLVAENPTRGLDIRAHKRPPAATRGSPARAPEWCSIPVTLDEVLHLATRVFVLHGAQLRECALDRDMVGRAMLGVA